jgi:hypothetical protein
MTPTMKLRVLAGAADRKAQCTRCVFGKGSPNGADHSVYLASDLTNHTIFDPSPCDETGEVRCGTIRDCRWVTGALDRRAVTGVIIPTALVYEVEPHGGYGDLDD